MSRLARAARRPAAAVGLFALLVAVFNWPLVAAPLGLPADLRFLALCGAWAIAVALLAAHAGLAGAEPGRIGPGGGEEGGTPDA